MFICERCSRQFELSKALAGHKAHCKDGGYSDAQLKANSENGRKTAERRKQEGFYSSEKQSIRRKNQLTHEEDMADMLREEGYEVFSPTVVCDRIAIKDNKVYFVEFKLPGQTLREGQQKVFEILPENYLIRYAK